MAEATQEEGRLAVERIPALAARSAGSQLWVDDSGSRTWSDFGAAVEALRLACSEAGMRRGDVAVVSAASGFELLAGLFGAAALGAVVAPLRPDRSGEIEGWKAHFAVGWLLRGGVAARIGEGRDSPQSSALLARLRARNHPGLILATGGTGGAPKLVLHDLESLLATVPVKAGRPWRVLPLMRFDHIGGLDMAWRALAGGQILIAPPASLTPEAVSETVARHGVEVMPATPSFLNLLLVAGEQVTARLGSLQVVPYGAEPMPAGLLARLKEALPRVAFVQRFGTSETGTLPVRAHDSGLVLGGGGGGFEWKVVECELWIRSPARALGYLAGGTGGFEAEGWFRTGDIAESRPDGSLRVLGRREDMINVGGEKVLPGGVEEVLMRHPLVADCRVTPLPNALLGQVVAAEIVWLGPERNPVSVKRMLHDHAASSLPKCHLPAVVRLVAAIETTRNLKRDRTAR